MSCSSAERQRLPGGPGGIPVLGAALKWKGPETNLEWTKQYGPIYSVRIGPNQLVYLNTIELVEEYMEHKGAAFLGRPEGPAAIANGLLFGQGDRWRENRQAFVRALHLAVTHRAYEAAILKEAEIVIDQLSEHLGMPVEMDTILLPALGSRLVTLLLGRRLDSEDEQMLEVVRQMQHLEEVDLTSKSTQMFLKLKVKHFRRPLEKVARRTIPDMFEMSDALQRLIHNWIEERRATMALAGGQADPNVLLDQLLTAPEYAARNEEFDKELIQSIMDLFNGGVTSSLSALEFTLLYLLQHPHVQRKIKIEIDQATADGHAISWANRHHFPYTQATLIESLRLASVTPSSLPHVATEDVEIAEQYQVPKNVFVMAGIYSLHRDPRFFPDPEKFRPERHLDKDKKVLRPRSYRPYGVGERMCVGYHLAEMELFLLLAHLMAEFQVSEVDPTHPQSTDTFMRVVRRLKTFICKLHRWDT